MTVVYLVSVPVKILRLPSSIRSRSGHAKLITLYRQKEKSSTKSDDRLRPMKIKFRDHFPYLFTYSSLQHCLQLAKWFFIHRKQYLPLGFARGVFFVVLQKKRCAAISYLELNINESLKAFSTNARNRSHGKEFCYNYVPALFRRIFTILMELYKAKLRGRIVGDVLSSCLNAVLIIGNAVDRNVILGIFAE